MNTNHVILEVIPMARVPSDKMITEPLQVNFSCCDGSCEAMKLYASNPSLLGEARLKCSLCRKIFKFDKHLYEYTQKKNMPKVTKRRSSVIGKRFGKAILALSSEGKSQREIAKILGISPTSVNKFLQE